MNDATNLPERVPAMRESPLRRLYNRYFRDTFVGETLRRVRYGGHRGAANRFFAILSRGRYVGSYYWQRMRPAFPWLLNSVERANFTYDLTDRNKRYLAEMLGVILNRPSSEIRGYIAEIDQDQALRDAIIGRARVIASDFAIDATAGYGRRLGWYAAARALKPKVVIETGIDKGLGAMVLCSAIRRNIADGFPGQYYGTDIDPGAGALVVEPYRSVATILYGDSIESLVKLQPRIDLFINDSDHSADYERREYETVLPMLAEGALIIGDNAHATDELQKFAQAKGRRFLFFKEEPHDHWYLGAGIGFSFK